MGNFLDPMASIEDGRVCSFWGAVAAAIPAVTSLLSSGGGGGGASQTTSRSPAPRDKDQQRFWDDFVDSWYGVDPKASGAAKAPAGDSSGIYWDMPEYFPQQALQWLQQEYEAGNITREERDYYAAKLFPHDAMYDPYANVDGTDNYGINAPDVKTVRDFIASKTTAPTAPTGDEGESGEKPKSYREMLEEDIGAQKQAGEDYLETLGGLSTDKTGAYQTATDEYRELLNELISDDRAEKVFENPMAGTEKYMTALPVSFRGMKFGVLSNNATRAADLISGRNLEGAKGLMDVNTQRGEFGGTRYGASTTLADTIYDTMNKLGLETRTQGQTFTPNKAAITYLKELQEMVKQIEDRRYGTPTQTTTANVDTDWGAEIGRGVDIFTKLYDSLKK